MRIVRESDKIVLAETAEVADTFWKRLKGLMFRPSLPPGDGLILQPCRQIHMMFMRFPIDAVFLDGENAVIKCYSQLSPWRGLTGYHSRAVKVIELPAGTVEKHDVKQGDKLLFEEA